MRISPGAWRTAAFTRRSPRPSVRPVTSHFRTTSPTTIIGATTIVPIAVSCPQSISVCVTSCEAAIGSVCESGPENVEANA